MKYIGIFFFLVLFASYSYAQEVIKRDSVGLQPVREGQHDLPQNAINEIENVFEPGLKIQDSPDPLFDISAPEMKADIEYPQINMDIKFSNSLPPLNEIDYKKGYIYSKQTEHFSLNENSFATLTSFSIDADMSYLLTRHLSIDFSRKHYSSVLYNPLLPNAAYRDQFGMGISIRITPNLKFKAGFEQVFNQMNRKWEIHYNNSLKYNF